MEIQCKAAFMEEFSSSFKYKTPTLSSEIRHLIKKENIFHELM
jgi:hypothetical protein